MSNITQPDNGSVPTQADRVNAALVKYQQIYALAKEAETDISMAGFHGGLALGVWACNVTDYSARLRNQLQTWLKTNA